MSRRRRQPDEVPVVPPDRGKTLFVRARAHLWLLAAATFSLVVAGLQLRLWAASWNVPFSYEGDGLFNGMLVKGLKDNAWALHNAFLGAPGQQSLHDFPKSYVAQFLVLKLLAGFCSNYASTMNLYYLLTYPLIMVVSCVVLVSFGLSRTAAFLSSALFTFLPYHLSRGEGHLLLGAYLSVPLAAWLIVRIHGAPLFGAGGGAGASEPRTSRQRLWRWLGPVALTMLIASWGVYYAFFAIALLLVSGAAAWLWDRRRSAVLTTVVLAAGIGLGVAVNLAPSLVYWQQHGGNVEVGHRHPGDGEANALKLSELLLPVTGHRIPALAELKARWAKYGRPVGEGGDATLGLLGSVGFLFLLGLLLRREPGQNDGFPRWLRVFVVCNLAAFLLGTTGGFGSLIALGGFTAIRSYARVCVFIAFFAFAALGFVVDRVLAHPRLAHRRRVTQALLLAILALGIWDQTPLDASPDYAKLRADFVADGQFVQSIEQSVPRGSMIFQLPYVSFPEGSNPGRMGAYSLVRGYLHSRALRWSFGAMRGRGDDRWQKEAAALPTSVMVARLRQAGFAGIYVDRSGYPDGGRIIETVLRDNVGPPALVSDARALAFYLLVPLAPLAR